VSTRSDTPSPSERDLCFIDIETTGARMGYHEIIDLAGIRTTPDARTVLGAWTKRAQPRYPERITPIAQRITGFDVATWGSAEFQTETFWKEFLELAKDCTPVCHNPSFERAFLTLSAAAVGVTELPLDYHWIGTESLAWPFFRMGLLPKLSLADLCRFLGLPEEPLVHSALEGAKACHRAYFALVTDHLIPAIQASATSRAR
jgi:DNA polymerase III epsilon subunit-like protein